MSTSLARGQSIPWWKEPTKDQWLAWWAAWLGWTLDAFDFTVFLLIMVPIAKEFNVPLTEVTAVFTITLWLRLVGATASGWLADRIGRKMPLMISILWYSICNFIAGFSPTFTFLFVFRALLGIGMGAEWPAGASLAMESWPARSRGFMSGVLQGSWAFGFLLSSAAYGLLFDHIGWRGLLLLGILPALAVVWVRKYVKEPEVWLKNRRSSARRRSEVAAPLFVDLQARLCWQHVDRVPVDGERLRGLLLDLGTVRDASAEGSWPVAGADRTPIAIANAVDIPRQRLLGLDRGHARPPLVDDHSGVHRDLRHADLSADQRSDLDRGVGFVAAGAFAGAIYGQNPSYLTERFPTEVRSTAPASATTRARSGAVSSRRS